MYYLVIRQFMRSLKNIDAILEKAQRHAEAKKFDVNNFLSARLAPDMFPFTRQVQNVCDIAKNAAAGLAGKEAPRHEDTEKTFEVLRGRVGKCLAYLEGFTAADFERTQPDALVKIPRPPGKAMRAQEYVLARALPNFYFHLTTAYNLLRQGGVELGKTDYLGPLELVDAR